MGEFITPPSLPPDIYCRRLSIPNTPQWIATVTGALMALIYEHNWVQVDGITIEDAANRAREMFDLYTLSGTEGDCGNMAQCCIEPVIIHRINPDTGRPEVSTDGGETWTPDPNDTQNQIILYPPLVTDGGSKTKCDAATNASEHVNELIEATHTNLEAASTVFDLAVAVAEAALLLFIVIVTGGAASPLVIGFATAIWAAAAGVFALGIEAYDAYWTEDKKDAILCAIYCNIGENGQFTETQYQAFRTAIKEQLPASPAFDIIMTSINAGGATGLSQMASYGNAALADCASCDCDITCNADLWSIVSSSGVPVGSILSRGDNWLIVQGSSHPDFGTPWNLMVQTASNDACCTPNTIEFLTGDHDDEQYFGVTCGAARWPGSPNGPVDLGVGEYNTLFLRKDAGSNFTAKITFG